MIRKNNAHRLFSSPENPYMRTILFRRTRLLQALCILITIILSGCLPQNDQEQVTIGGQGWSGRNLDVDHYRNGDPVRHARTEAEWHDAASQEEGAWCWYEGSAGNGKVHARLYNWYAVNDPRGLAPEGWRIPSDSEWQQLVDALGGDAAAGGPLKKSESWVDHDGTAQDQSGFDALPSGSRNCLGGFFALGRDAFYWSSTPSGEFEAWNREISSRNTGVRRVSVNRSIGFSVRCVKN
ncbi:fibrobacter succinogenes major paralogous domain-containing protein [Chlorobium sp.]|uniref:fibrobacter succinogenes major paralogous domain-containing protein n=1 Tax=Chlorobium sp. TaxID=1095 RepID=UPI0025B81D7C|nr:fibrobacter succinogenes major paralogous domain-containing protein [Chlorobium sp.]